MDPTNTTDEQPARDPDPRKWSKAEIIAGLNRLPIPSCTLHVHRADRHDVMSEVQALTLVCDGVLTFDAITQIAGLFETPHITFEPKCVPHPDAPTPEDETKENPYNEIGVVEIVVKWEAPVPVSKVASPTPMPESTNGIGR